MTQPDEDENAVTVVTVTYGRRFTLLCRTLSSVLQSSRHVRDVVVVDNGCPTPVGTIRAELERICGASRLHLLREEKNSGSAGGFRLAIESAVMLTCNALILVVDDDTAFKGGGIDILRKVYVDMGCSPMNALVALRVGRREYELAANGKRPLHLSRNSAFGFHWGRVVRRLRGAEVDRTTAAGAVVEIDYGPYGGLFLHREALQTTKPPNRDFYLYGDDTEYTLRLRAGGVRLFLVPSCQLVDLEESWDRKSISPHTLFRRSVDLDRLYFTVRNRVFLERSHLVTNKLVYAANVAGILVLMLVRGVIHERCVLCHVRTIRMVLLAGVRGWRGELGDTSTVPLHG